MWVDCKTRKTGASSTGSIHWVGPGSKLVVAETGGGGEVSWGATALGLGRAGALGPFILALYSVPSRRSLNAVKICRLGLVQIIADSDTHR